jgi:uncharacterized protein (TIGR02453 family)
MDIKAVLKFLEKLEENNNREWFLAHKSEYEFVKEQVGLLTIELLKYLKTIDSNLYHLEPKDCTYRIYRDVRFSKDKSPYKNHIGLFFAKGGKSSFGPGYYVHFQKGESFVGGGVYVPDGVKLKAIRQEIFYNIDDFLSILKKESFANFYNGIYDYGKLKKAPLGYDSDFEHIDILKNKSFVVSSPIDAEGLTNMEMLEYTKKAFFELKPFVDFFDNVSE